MNWILPSQKIQTIADSVDSKEKHYKKMLLQNGKNLIEALDHMQEFVDRVDKGEVKSIRTYSKFKNFLSKFK